MLFDLKICRLVQSRHADDKEDFVVLLGEGAAQSGGSEGMPYINGIAVKCGIKD